MKRKMGCMRRRFNNTGQVLGNAPVLWLVAEEFIATEQVTRAAAHGEQRTSLCTYRGYRLDQGYWRRGFRLSESWFEEVR